MRVLWRRARSVNGLQQKTRVYTHHPSSTNIQPPPTPTMAQPAHCKKLSPLKSRTAHCSVCRFCRQLSSERYLICRNQQPALLLCLHSLTLEYSIHVIPFIEAISWRFHTLPHYFYLSSSYHKCQYLRIYRSLLVGVDLHPKVTSGQVTKAPARRQIMRALYRRRPHCYHRACCRCCRASCFLFCRDYSQ